VPVDSLSNALRWDPFVKIDTLVRRDLASLGAGATVAEAFARMRDSSQVVFPVTNAAGELVGLLDRRDVAAALGMLPQGAE
jgi:CBS domain-containing protein